MYQIKKILKKFLPKKLLSFYHLFFAYLASLIYGQPSKKITVIGVTGTKGKSSTLEITNAIFEKAGYKTAIASTIRFKLGEKSEHNKKKMTMPGRFFLQKFIKEAVDLGCQIVFLEMTSEGSAQHRHRFIELDTLLLTNITPEHIESHGSYEKYVEAKLNIATQLVKSKKSKKTFIVNAESKEKNRFIDLVKKANIKILEYSIKQAEPYAICAQINKLTLFGKSISSKLLGEFNIYNILAAKTLAEHYGIDKKIIIKTIEEFNKIPGRMERVESQKKAPFEVFVDYAHTKESLEQVYQSLGEKKKICVLGGTGGGRDVWKREEMGKIADQYCQKIFLTNEDPYDEDPDKIIEDIKKGIKQTEIKKVLDRRQAIAEALREADEHSIVIITGKGTDPYIMEADGKKTAWSDYQVAKEELEKIF